MGYNEIPAEELKGFDESAVNRLKILENKIYVVRQQQDDFLQVIMVSLLKKKHVRKL